MSNTPMAQILKISYAAAIIMCVGIAAVPASADETPALHTLSVTGDGEIQVTPNIVVLKTGIESRGKTTVEALAANKKIMADIFTGLEKLKVSKSDMQTSDFSIYPLYEKGAHPQYEHTDSKIIAYQVSNQLTIKLRKVDELGNVLNELVSLGSNLIGGISYDIDDPEKYYTQARKAAVADAFNKAKILADAAGVELGEVLAIDDGRMADNSGWVAGGADIPVASGQKSVSSTVRMTIAIH